MSDYILLKETDTRRRFSSTLGRRLLGAVDQYGIKAENSVRSRPQTYYEQFNYCRRHYMTIQKAIEHFRDHQRTSLKKRTQEGYKKLLEHFQSEFSDRDIVSIKAEELCWFLETYTEGLAKATRRLRYAQLRALFNFSIDTFEMNIKNPCCVPQLFKSFKNIQQRPRKILDKETVDEIIFNSKNTRDRLILELQARCGLRVGEVLNLKVSDVSQRKLMLQEPKSGREVEVAFMPEHIASGWLTIFPVRIYLQPTGYLVSAIQRPEILLLNSGRSSMFTYHRMIFVDILPHMPVGMVFPWRSSQKSSCDIRTWRLLRYISARWVIQKQSGGWTFYTGNRK
jgi:integrase